MVDEWGALERRILQATPKLEPSARDRMLYEAGAAAERLSGRRRRWISSAGSALAAVAATWLLMTFTTTAGWSRRNGPTTEFVQTPAPRASAPEVVVSPEKQDMVLTASGVAVIASERPIATSWSALQETPVSDVGDERVWRAGVNLREWEF